MKIKAHSVLSEEDKFTDEGFGKDNYIFFEQKINKQINELNYFMNKKEDDLKNIINEKDFIIQEMSKKLKEQENKILQNRYETINLFIKLGEMVNKFNYELKQKNINTELDLSFLNIFEKNTINSKMLLEEKDIIIANKICGYIEKIASFNNNGKLKLDLKSLMINCDRPNIDGLIFNIKNNITLNQEDKDSQNYEIKIIKEVFTKIVPTFCQDIISSILSGKLGPEYKQFNELVIEIYKESHCYNFESFFKKIESKKNIIYTFSEITEDIFDTGNNIENEYGIFNREKAIEYIYSNKNVKNLKDKKILILRFSENELNKINSVNYSINNFQKENHSLKDKIILFIILMQRVRREDPHLISFIYDEYYQIFIDNLKGKENTKDYLQRIKELLHLPNNKEKDKGEYKSLLSIIEEKNNNYVLIKDNFEKMFSIIYRIKSNIPVIFMWEIDCGKTSLIIN